MNPTTEQFIDTVFGPEPKRTGKVWVCRFPSWSPDWGGGTYPRTKPARGENNFFAVSTYRADGRGKIRRAKDHFAAMHVLVADDVGTKANTPTIEPTYKIETSPGNYQWGWVLADPVRDGDAADAVVDALIAKGYCDPGADGPQARYVRLPGINGKPEHKRDGISPAVEFREWHPDRRFTVGELVKGLGLELGKAKPDPAASEAPGKGNRAEWIRQILAGENLHGATLSLANSLVARGTPAGVVIDTIQNLMDASAAAYDDRFVERYSDIPRLVADAVKEYGPKPATPLAVIEASDYVKRPRAQWIIKDILPRAEFGVLYGESGAGKSFVAVDLAWAVAKGSQWLGKRVKPCRVVYVVAEGSGGFQTRLEALAKHRGESLDGVPIGIIAAAPNLLEGGEVALMNAIAASAGAGLVIVDTLAQTTPGANENTSEDMGKAIAAIKRIAEATGAMVLVVHHAGKDLGRGARGWSGMKGAADVQLQTSRDGDERTLCVEKSKDGADGMKYGFQLETVGLGHDDDGDPVSSCVVNWVPRSAPAWRPAGKWQRLAIAVVNNIISNLEFDDKIDESLPTVSLSVADVVEEMVSKEAKPPAKVRDRRGEQARRALNEVVAVGLYSYADDGLTLKVPYATNAT